MKPLKEEKALSVDEDWDIEETDNGEGLKFSWKDEKAKHELLRYIGAVGGLTEEEIEKIIKRVEE